MQKIVKTKRIEKDSINILNCKISLRQVEQLESLNGEKEGDDYVGTFSDGYMVPCITIQVNDSERKTITFQNFKEIGATIFDMPDHDAEKMSMYLMGIAEQLKVYVIQAKNGILLVSKILKDRADVGESWEKVMDEIERGNRDLGISASSMGAATIVAKAVEYGINWYNNRYYQDNVIKVAEIIKDSRVIGDDGDDRSLTIKEVEQFMDNVKGQISIGL